MFSAFNTSVLAFLGREDLLFLALESNVVVGEPCYKGPVFLRAPFLPVFFKDADKTSL